jgi:hypothetical protein
MNANTLLAIVVIIAIGTVMGLTVIPALTTDAHAATRRCDNPNGKEHPGNGNSQCPPGLAKREIGRDPR